MRAQPCEFLKAEVGNQKKSKHLERQRPIQVKNFKTISEYTQESFMCRLSGR